jgi:hypothetical protein
MPINTFATANSAATIAAPFVHHFSPIQLAAHDSFPARHRPLNSHPTPFTLRIQCRTAGNEWVEASRMLRANTTLPESGNDEERMASRWFSLRSTIGDPPGCLRHPQASSRSTTGILRLSVLIGYRTTTRSSRTKTFATSIPNEERWERRKKCSSVRCLKCDKVSCDPSVSYLFLENIMQIVSNEYKRSCFQQGK